MREVDSPSVVVETAKEETTRQVIILVFSVVGAGVAAYISKNVYEPDFGRNFKMRAALCAKRIAGQQVDWWQSIADKAATVYNRERD